jgi:hypothetical protein
VNNMTNIIFAMKDGIRKLNEQLESLSIQNTTQPKKSVYDDTRTFARVYDPRNKTLTSTSTLCNRMLKDLSTELQIEIDLPKYDETLRQFIGSRTSAICTYYNRHSADRVSRLLSDDGTKYIIAKWMFSKFISDESVSISKQKTSSGPKTLLFNRLNPYIAEEIELGPHNKGALSRVNADWQIKIPFTKSEKTQAMEQVQGWVGYFNTKNAVKISKTTYEDYILIHKV